MELGSGRLIHSHCSPGLQYAALSPHLHHPTLHLTSPWSPRAPGQSGEVVLGREAAALGKQLTYKQLTGHHAQWAEPTCPKQTLEQEASPAIHSLPRLEEREARSTLPPHSHLSLLTCLCSQPLTTTGTLRFLRMAWSLFPKLCTLLLDLRI